MAYWNTGNNILKDFNRISHIKFKKISLTDSNNEFCNYKSFLQLDTINPFYI